jgi:two-component system OmpR family response regulator
MKKLNGLKVLVVEDDPDLREVVSDDFSISGAIVQCAASGQEAMSIIRKSQFDFIFSDLRMPNGDGRYLAQELLTIQSPRPVFFIYSGDTQIDVNEMRALNIAQVFSKPFSFSKIVDSILSYLPDKRSVA